MWPTIGTAIDATTRISPEERSATAVKTKRTKTANSISVAQPRPIGIMKTISTC